MGPNHVWDAGGFTQTMARTGVICPTTAYEETFDCNYNDYYDPLLPSSMDPAVNVANSPYLTVPVVRPAAPPGDSYLSDLPAVTSTSGYGPVERDRSNGEAAAGDGNPITLNGVVYSKGLGAHAFSEITYNLAGAYRTFTTDVGVDDEMTGLHATIVFEVWVDGIKRFDSGVMSAPSPTQAVSVDISGAQQLKLVITDAGDGITGDHGDWAGARLTTTSSPADRTTTTTLTSSPNPSLESQRVYLTVGVFGDCGPTGKVRLYVDGTRVRTFVLENGTPRFSARTLSVGTHTIRADYRGSATCDASTATVIQEVRAR